MNVTVRLFGSLRDYSDGDGLLTLDMSEGSNVRDLLGSLELPEGEIKIIMVNGRRVSSYAVIRDGDRVGIFPPIAGG